jgi:hypothetical protein
MNESCLTNLKKNWQKVSGNESINMLFMAVSIIENSYSLSCNYSEVQITKAVVGC